MPSKIKLMNKHFKSIIGITILATALISCEEKTDQNNQEESVKEHHGINLEYMDTTVSPRQNFYQYVNGTWMKDAVIPEDRKSWGSFYILRQNTDKTVLGLLNSSMEDNNFSEESDQNKAILLYESELDTTKRRDTGLKPLQPTMEKINGITDLEQLQATIDANPIKIANPFYSIYASAKLNNSAINGAYLSPGKLGLPDRAYYTNTDEKSKKTRQQYTNHITRIFQLWGDDEATAKNKAEKILALETKLAEPRFTKEERRDVRKQNNPRSIEEIAQLTPAINWKQWIGTLPVKKEVDTITVTQLNYMKALQEILTHTDIEDLKTLMAWATLNSAASDLTPELEKANWDFYSNTLNGTPKQRPADERALATVNKYIGEALGEIYVDKVFPPEAKETAESMVKDIIEVYKNRINNLSWMTDSTKQRAIEKLNKLTIKIGYPDQWKDYSEMEIKPGNTYYENMVAAAQWRYIDNLSRINEPVDRKEWHMNPQTVNAYYNPSQNEIVFPAAILQPPFFDYKADAAVNFGGIGAVIGHEISHAFDDSGARFDAKGNLNNWWTKDDLDKFSIRTQKLADFYSKIKIKGEDSLYLNGKFTLGENTADLGGVLAAFHGMERYYKTHDKPEKIDGFTQEQRFFLSWATVWRTKSRHEALVTQIKTDPHSPGYYRAFLPLQNVDAFYSAFDVQEGDSMYVAPEDRIRIW